MKVRNANPTSASGRGGRTRAAAALATLMVGAMLAFTGCASETPRGAIADERPVRVITTTGILADLVSNVGGDRVDVSQLVPDGADPHSYEPTLGSVRDVVYADAAFTNYLMLEEQSVVRTVDANLRDGVPNISLAESAVRYAAEVIPLVEDVSLDTVWLGTRVMGSGAEFGADRSSRVHLSALALDGPGQMYAYLTGTFGETTRFFTCEGEGKPCEKNRDGEGMTLPPDAHTHLSWAFTEPGIYRLQLEASLTREEGGEREPLTRGEVTFAVGVDPYSVKGARTIISRGHSDITVDLAHGELGLAVDDAGSKGEPSQTEYLLDEVVVDVPTTALHEVPGDPAYRFLGRAGQSIYQLPQAVLGKHVHGEIDPHLWHNVKNAIAYVEVIRDTLSDVDPAGAETYRAQAARYRERLELLDDEVRETIESIPASRRTLVTTHDAFGYLGAAYGMRIAGFVTPNPATEPSLSDRKRLGQTMRDMHIRAVFLEPNLAARSATLTEVAKEHGVSVCPIYGDAFDERVDTYIDMMRFNAASLKRCLGGSGSEPQTDETGAP